LKNFFLPPGIKIDGPLRHNVHSHSEMPYSADLRCSYAITELNVDWFYETCPHSFDFKSNSDMKAFHRFLDDMVTVWVTHKVFGHKQFVESDMCQLDDTETVWEWLSECALWYVDKHPEEVWVEHVDSEDDSDTDNEDQNKNKK
jgi:hypothetical protein